MIIRFQRKGFRFSIRLTVLAVFAIATILTAAVAIGLQFYFSRAMVIDSTLAKYQASAESTRNFIRAEDKSAHQLARILARHPHLLVKDQINPDLLALFSEVMLNNDPLYAIYVGLDDGAFFQVVNLDSGKTVRSRLRALPEDRWVVIKVQGANAERTRTLEYYDAELNLRALDAKPSDYDPRVRPWYTNANRETVYKTKPYLFQHLQAPGQSYSMRLPDGTAVLAVDRTLASLSSFLSSQAHASRAEIYLYQPGGELIATNQNTLDPNPLPYVPPIALTEEEAAYIRQQGTIRVSNELDWPPIDYAVSAQPQGYAVDLLQLIGTMTGLNVEFVNGYSWPELVKLFDQGKLDILQPIYRNQMRSQQGTLSQAFLTLPYAIVTRAGQPDIKSLTQLNNQVIAVPSGWSVITDLQQHFPGIRILEVATLKDALQAVQQGTAYATLDAAPVLHYIVDHYYLDNLQFHESSDLDMQPLPDRLHMLMAPNQLPLHSIINKALANLSQHARDQLANKWFKNPSSEAELSPRITVPYRNLFDNNPTTNDQLQQLKLAGQKQFVYQAKINPQQDDSEVFAVVISAESLLAASMNRVKLSVAITSICLLILLPFIWLFANPIVRPIRRLAIENARIKHRQYDDVEFHDSHIIEIYELSHSIVDMAETIKQHEEAQRALMESLIQLIARAIDEKSPYTAGHCARVPELALMLAQAAEESESPPFRDFRFNNADEYLEFRIGAWLHDCGKITTPEHVVDKGTKLETIYNRIHEIRTRFEVLWRDAEIQYLQALAKNPSQQQMLHEKLLEKRQQLQDDFRFIANLNQGGEFVSEAALLRMQKIAMVTWQRHFDDGLGLSPVEALRHPSQKKPLPTTETLLADKPEHIIEYEKPKHYPEHLHINMDIPEHLYNLGEIYNLSVARGTLSREDRFKIQEHMISTISMLDALPFPPELARVPRYASTHHETLDGTGYPRRIGADELSIPERIMAVADIFEALTAADRPYKTAKTISASIAILHKMVTEGHIDKDVFELFLSSGVYRQYGQRYLRPEQLDEIPLEQYLGS